MRVVQDILAAVGFSLGIIAVVDDLVARGAFLPATPMAITRAALLALIANQRKQLEEFASTTAIGGTRRGCDISFAKFGVPQNLDQALLGTIVRQRARTVSARSMAS
jgi:hypothetical protein